MPQFVIPANLATADDGAMRAWTGDLPRLVADIAQRWALRVADPFEPGGTCSWVAPVRDAAGRDLVLKVCWRHPEAAHEAEGLAFWAGDGAVALHAAEAFDDRTSALLLERCVPGTALSETVEEADQDVIVAGMLARLWREPGEGHPFRSLQVMCEQWAAGFERRFSTAPGGLDPGLARTGLQLWRALPASAESSVVLCTDLHAGNILAAERESWLVCDPKPYVGDPAFDVLQHMLNCESRLVADPVGFAHRMAALLDLDPERLGRWLLARCVIEAPESAALQGVAARLAP